MTKDRNEVLSWLGANDKASMFVKEQAAKARPFEELGREWLAGVEAGRISRRRGRGQPYSETTIADYRRSYRNVLEPEFGAMVADEIGEIEWQMRRGTRWQVSRRGSSARTASFLLAGHRVGAMDAHRGTGGQVTPARPAG